MSFIDISGQKYGKLDLSSDVFLDNIEKIYLYCFNNKYKVEAKFKGIGG